MKKKRCKTCKGWGVVLKVVSDLQYRVCNCDYKNGCYLCENTKRMGPYKECEICWGAGECTPTITQEQRIKKSQQLLRNG